MSLTQRGQQLLRFAGEAQTHASSISFAAYTLNEPQCAQPICHFRRAMWFEQHSLRNLTDGELAFIRGSQCEQDLMLLRCEPDLFSDKLREVSEISQFSPHGCQRLVVRLVKHAIV